VIPAIYALTKGFRLPSGVHGAVRCTHVDAAARSSVM